MVVLLKNRENKEKLVQKILRNAPEKHHEMILDAIDFMEEVHKGQKRLSGEDFSFHPLNVGAIVADMNLDSTSIVTALLHNTIRDKTGKERQEIISMIQERFTIEIASMIIRIELFSHGTRSKSDSDTITKFIMRSGKDLRLIIVKLADRLDNARTVDALDPKKQREVANNLINIYSPLCTYLNLYEFKKELEEIAFRILKPNEYSEIDEYISELHNRGSDIVGESIKYLKEISQDLSVNPNIFGRIKSHFSLYRKLKGKSKYANVREVQDLFAFTILVDTEEECFNIAKYLFKNSDVDLPNYDDYNKT
jgi:GTP pyrophosphokinase